MGNKNTIKAVIGNDLVHLPSLSQRAKTLDKAYLSKFCTKEEIELILLAKDPVIKMAEVWATKECAFKWAMRMGATRIFNPKAFTFSNNWVSFENEKWRYKSVCCLEYVYCFLEGMEGQTLNWILDLESLDTHSTSSCCWSFFLDYLAKLTNSSLEEWKVIYHQKQIPSLHHLPSNKILAVSCTHDGPYWAWSIGSTIEIHH